MTVLLHTDATGGFVYLFPKITFLRSKIVKQGGHRYWKNLKILEYTGKKYWYLIILEVLKKCPFFQYILENDKLEYLKILEFYFSIKSSIPGLSQAVLKYEFLKIFLFDPTMVGPPDNIVMFLYCKVPHYGLVNLFTHSIFKCSFWCMLFVGIEIINVFAAAFFKKTTSNIDEHAK